jgi:predicted Ser/Thr protein kinase
MSAETNHHLQIAREEAELLSADAPGEILPWKPAIWTLTADDRPMVVKDVRRTSPLFRYTLGRLSLWREGRIYQRLDGMPFVPRYLGRLDADAIILERIEATPIQRFRGEEIDPTFFDELQECVAALHRRGVVHMDLRHRSNLLVGSDGKPRILDFEAAFYLGTNFLARWLLVPLLATVNRSAVTKYRIRYEKEVTGSQARRHRWFRVFRKLWPFKRIWPPQRKGQSHRL